MAGASVAQKRGHRRREAVDDGVRGGRARGVVHALAIAACTKQMTLRFDMEVITAHPTELFISCNKVSRLSLSLEIHLFVASPLMFGHNGGFFSEEVLKRNQPAFTPIEIRPPAGLPARRTLLGKPAEPCVVKTVPDFVNNAHLRTPGEIHSDTHDRTRIAQVSQIPSNQTTVPGMGYSSVFLHRK